MKRLVKSVLIVVALGLAVLALPGPLFNSSCCGKQLSNDEINLLKISAEAGNVESLWALQEDAAERGDVEVSLAYLKRLAVQFHLGEARYLYFSTIANDASLFAARRTEAVDQLITAANEGHVGSQFFLGFYYQEGQFGFQRNREEAIRWYVSAEKNGSEAAAYI